jgi:DHA2 family multidrug resistance protein-like MFS transporter
MTILVAMCVVMLGTGPLAALCNHLAMGAVPAAKAGSGASIVQTTNEFGLGLGIATLATLGTAVYRSNVQGALADLPSDVADAARESVDRAVAAAGRLPAEPGGDLLAAARDAFTSGLHVVTIVSAVLYAALAVVAVRAFAHTPLGGDHTTTTTDQASD